MRVCFLSASAGAVLLAIVACSSTELPPTDGDCVSVDGSTCSVNVIGGSSSGGEGGADGGSCSETAGGSQCGVCAASGCCSELEQCSGSTDCTNLLNCENDCSGGSACVDACQQQFPTAVSTLQLLSSCLTRLCPICAESGVGDPCGAGYYACETGLTCNGRWCTKSCIHASDCEGIGAGGTNSLGFTSACMASSQGDLCVPGCAGAAGACTDFAGTYCLATTAADGTSVSVCTSLPDASTGD
ncbi:MAG TPA: hypothetical protein VGL81_07690 [Polyangiaceae bacterium]